MMLREGWLFRLLRRYKWKSSMPNKIAIAFLTVCCVVSSFGNGQICAAAPATAEKAFPEWAEWNASPNHSNRRAAKITAIICHYTAGGSLSGTVRKFQDPASKVSSHYVIDKDGKTVQMVALDRTAWHAGTSILAGVERVNDFSIGIEIVNWGKLTKRDDKFYTGSGELYQGPKPIHANGAYWEPFTDKQYQAVIRLTTALLAKYPIQHITGHSDVATPKGRKIDPGGAFDWKRIQAALPKDYKGQIGPISRP
jgi:N-acetylmuramoyl-L-alanine amidase